MEGRYERKTEVVIKRLAVAAFNIGIDFGVAKFPPRKFPPGGGQPDYRGHSPRDGAEGTARGGD